MPSQESAVQRREILQVVETTQSVFFMTIVYEEGDIGSAVGHVYAFDAARKQGVAPTQVLATNDSLRVMWASPSRALWVASADGFVGTTAKVSWPAAGGGAEYLTLGGSPAWTATALPRVRQTKLPPNVTALWGTSDEDVHAGTYGGHIYHWDGVAWTQVHDGPGGGKETVRAFGGGSRNDVFAGAADSTLLHFDGTAWMRLQLPGVPNGHETVTGIVGKKGGEVVISASGDQGRLIHGTAGALAEIGRYPQRLIDMAALGGRLFFATGDGVAELTGRNVSMIKSNFRTATMNAGIDRLFVIEPAQDAPRFAEYDPRKVDAPWWRYTF
jgi:hypothetical protein